MPQQRKKLTKEDDADDDEASVLEQGVVEYPGGERGHVEDGVQEPRVPVMERRQQDHGVIIHH